MEVDGAQYIYEGHHRNFAMAHLGRTLIPYRVIAKDDETVGGGNNTARQRANGLKMSYLYGHEGFFEYDTKESFSYSDIYPELVEQLIEKESRPKKTDLDDDEMPI